MSTNLAKSLHNENMLYFVLGSLISSDSIASKEDVEKSTNALSMIEDELERSTLEDNVKSGYKEMIKKCYEVLTLDLKTF